MLQKIARRWRAWITQHIQELPIPSEYTHELTLYTTIAQKHQEISSASWARVKKAQAACLERLAGDIQQGRV